MNAGNSINMDGHIINIKSNCVLALVKTTNIQIVAILMAQLLITNGCITLVFVSWAHINCYSCRNEMRASICNEKLDVLNWYELAQKTIWKWWKCDKISLAVVNRFMRFIKWVSIRWCESCDLNQSNNNNRLLSNKIQCFFFFFLLLHN